MVSGGVPETQRLSLTFDPGKTLMESGFSRMCGGSVGEQKQTLLLQCLQLRMEND